MKKGSFAKQERRERAEELATERATRTPQQQLERLDQMFGEGQGATKERAQLLSQIEQASKPVPKTKKKGKKDGKP
jgi:ABC-type enterochelin transport system substrate-binding protein